MDAGQFDTLARSMGQRLPRRQALRALGAVLIGAGAWHEPDPAAARKCKLVGERCGKGISGRCCGGSFCRRRKTGRGSCACRAGLSECNGYCFDISSDPLACGARCRTCAEDTDCCNGVCRPPRWRCCDGGCTDLTADDANCGGCTQVCPADTTCCDSRCRRFDSDPRHCGACGHACGAGFICLQGQCVCPPGRPDCGDGICRDVQTDASNCGGCGVTCPRAYACQAGQCVCGPQSQVCHGNIIRPCGLTDHAVCTSDLDCCRRCDREGLIDGTGRCAPAWASFAAPTPIAAADLPASGASAMGWGSAAAAHSEVATASPTANAAPLIAHPSILPAHRTAQVLYDGPAAGVVNQDCRECYQDSARCVDACVDACVGGRCQF